MGLTLAKVGTRWDDTCKSKTRPSELTPHAEVPSILHQRLVTILATMHHLECTETLLQHSIWAVALLKS